MKRPEPEPKDVEIEVDGKKHHGWYRVQGGVVTVSTLDGHKRAQLGGSSAERLARLLLHEIVADSTKRCGGISAAWDKPL